MKKALVLIALSCLFLNGYSQQDSLLRAKSGKLILPQKGEFAIGIGTNPIFDFLGNMLSSSGYNSLRLGLLNGNVIYGKYFLTSQSALRIKFGLFQNKIDYENSIFDDTDLTNTKKVTDKLEFSTSNIDFSLGYEKRKGSSRLQVSYGGELRFNIDKYSRKYTYGNAFSSSNTYPTSTYDFPSQNVIEAYSRPLEITRDQGLAIGARLFTGLEYFVFPKISIGGEFGLGYLKRFNTKAENSTEMWDYSSERVKIEDLDTENNSSNINTDFYNGQLFLLFHF